MTVIAVLLTFGSGATDVASFTRLGDVFASVMTGNIVLFGLSLARGSVSLAAHTAVSFAGYVLGVAGGTRIAWFHATRADRSDPESDAAWPPHITLVLLLEFLLMAGMAVGWELTGGRPAGAAQFAMLAAAAAAMGIQASAVTDMSLKEVSTTYLTGTLTGLVGILATPRDGERGPGYRRPAVLIGLACGAILAGVGVAHAPAAVPLLPLAALIMVIVMGSGADWPVGRGYRPPQGPEGR
jgi:uncharacterized membrane protein YoaK (UPF0700 family)